jgi:multidrug efflux pump subunit AcrA (membrane-fusion protein)
MTLRGRYIVIVAVTVIVAATLPMKRPLRDASAKEAEEPAQRLLPIVLASRVPLENVITLLGEFRPVQQVDVRAKVSSYIREIFVDVADEASTGQVLAISEVPELNAQVMGEQADIRRSQGAISRCRTAPSGGWRRIG